MNIICHVEESNSGAIFLEFDGYINTVPLLNHNLCIMVMTRIDETYRLRMAPLPGFSQTRNRKSDSICIPLKETRCFKSLLCNSDIHVFHKQAPLPRAVLVS
eukprot:Lithocolla_globosa_v1_NODE_96_length_6498_cov_20.614310.p8 type:complete len:102 gc:universal NODE_96_length_6498_cov_20.614310:5012-4707(-)